MDSGDHGGFSFCSKIDSGVCGGAILLFLLGFCKAVSFGQRVSAHVLPFGANEKSIHRSTKVGKIF